MIHNQKYRLPEAEVWIYRMTRVKDGQAFGMVVTVSECERVDSRWRVAQALKSARRRLMYEINL